VARLAISAVVVALLAGCGGSDAGDGGYVKRVDALCKKANPDLVAIQTALVQARDRARAGEAKPAETFREFERRLAEAESVTRRLTTGLREVSPPSSEEEFHDDLLRSAEEGGANLRLQRRAARRGDAVALRNLSLEGSRISARSKGLVNGHGDFRFCGRG
jgi:hypothetical protein